MKITKSQLKEIIKEEIEQVLLETATGVAFRWGGGPGRKAIEVTYEQLYDFMLGTPQDPRGLLEAWMEAVKVGNPLPYKEYLGKGDIYEGAQRAMFEKLVDKFTGYYGYSNQGETILQGGPLSPEEGESIQKRYRGDAIRFYRQAMNKLFAHFRQLAEENELMLNGNLPSARGLGGAMSRMMRGF